jgi:hypothetical protein
VAWRAAGEAHRRRPQGIIGRGQQHFVAAVEECLHRHDDEFGDAIADVDVVYAHTRDVFLLRVVHDRLARGEKSLGVRIARGVGQVVDDILEDFFRRLEAERRGVADVELDDALAVFLHRLGACQHRAANVVADIGEFGGLRYRLHG